VVVLAMVVGMPLGIALGRLTWNLFASNYGVVSIVVVPWWQGVAILAGGLVVVTAISLLPASYAARRVHPRCCVPGRPTTSGVSGQPETERRYRTQRLPGRTNSHIDGSACRVPGQLRGENLCVSAKWYSPVVAPRHFTRLNSPRPSGCGGARSSPLQRLRAHERSSHGVWPR